MNKKSWIHQARARSDPSLDAEVRGDPQMNLSLRVDPSEQFGSRGDPPEVRSIIGKPPAGSTRDKPPLFGMHATSVRQCMSKGIPEFCRSEVPEHIEVRSIGLEEEGLLRRTTFGVRNHRKG